MRIRSIYIILIFSLLLTSLVLVNSFANDEREMWKQEQIDIGMVNKNIELGDYKAAEDILIRYKDNNRIMYSVDFNLAYARVLMNKNEIEEARKHFAYAYNNFPYLLIYDEFLIEFEDLLEKSEDYK